MQNDSYETISYPRIYVRVYIVGRTITYSDSLHAIYTSIYNNNDNTWHYLRVYDARIRNTRAGIIRPLCQYYFIGPIRLRGKFRRKRPRSERGQDHRVTGGDRFRRIQTIGEPPEYGIKNMKKNTPIDSAF